MSASQQGTSNSPPRSRGAASPLAGKRAARAGATSRGWGETGTAGARGEGGSTLVEFALVVLVLLTMMLGAIDFSRALYTYHFLDHAAKSAARWAAVNGYTCSQDGSCTFPTGAQPGDVQAYVTNITPTGIDANQITTAVNWPVQPASSADPSPPICSGPVSGLSVAAIPNYPGCTVEVQVSYPFNFLYSLVHSGAITLSSTSEMVIAH
ncbi:MAG TPA: TadE family protein [Candidatus Acidoferrales bacterium]|nr:TadE family protein [Candidatus Acidoferrales bacterium]